MDLARSKSKKRRLQKIGKKGLVQYTLSAKISTSAKPGRCALSANTNTHTKRAERAKHEHADPSPLQQL